MLKSKYTYCAERGNGTIELQGISFLADEETIFGERNEEYIMAELAWYESADKRVQRLFEIYGKEVSIWKRVADERGEVNSNYGYCIYSSERGSQYVNVLNTLLKDPLSRQAVMIYQHPDMHSIAGKDFTCTNAVQYFINKRYPKSPDYLDCVVQMRSNDVVFGYNNDRAWQLHVLEQLAKELGVHVGNITWQVGSLHIYERHYKYLESN